MRILWIAAAVMAMTSVTAGAKLPAPSPEQVEAAATKSAQEQANAEIQKALLAKAQDRVVEYYKRTKGASAAGAGTGRAGQTQSSDIPKAAVVPAGQAGPKGGTQQSAEAHSAPAK